jgi:putative PIN family toxin of toxin-antitoxin system
MSSQLVLDTNTVLALWMFRDPRLAPLRAFIEDGRCSLHGRADALGELRLVLAYPQFGVEPDAQAALHDAYRARLNLLADAPPADAGSLPACRDSDDQKFLEIARDAGASHLITRDKALLKLARHRLVRDRFAVLTPERFVAQLADNYS